MVSLTLLLLSRLLSALLSLVWVYPQISGLYNKIVNYVFLLTAVATVTPIPNGSLNQHSDSRPVYPQAPRPGIYPAPGSGRAHVTVDVSNPPSEATYSQGSYDSRSSLVHQPPANLMMGPTSSPMAAAALANADAKRNTQLGHPLKSFTVPAPPPQSAPPIKIVSPNNSGNRQSASVNPNPQSSPYKKAMAAAPVSSPPIVHKGNVGSRAIANDLKPPEKIQSSYSTEELNQEMANLEGLMKDLNAITANEFGC